MVTWGGKDYGGDSSAVQHQLKSGVVEISAASAAFAALRADGSVVTWGSPQQGGDSSSAMENSASGDFLICQQTG